MVLSRENEKEKREKAKKNRKKGGNLISEIKNEFLFENSRYQKR